MTFVHQTQHISTPPGLDPNDTWYSCEIQTYGSWNEDGDLLSSYDTLLWREYAVVRTTPKGVWLRDFAGEFFVLGTAIRQRALPTKELALQDLVRKQDRHVRGCTARLDRAMRKLKMAQRAHADIKTNQLKLEYDELEIEDV